MSSTGPSKSEGKREMVACCRCKTTTYHTIEKAVSWSEHYEEADIRFWGDYQIITCNGCNSVSFRLIHSDTEDWTQDPVDGGIIPLEKEKLYPKRKRHEFDELYLRDELYGIPGLIRQIYTETISAVENELPTLAGIGIRAVIEAVCKDLKAKKRNLEANIDELVKKSMLTPDGAEILHGIRLLGNKAAHEVKPPTTRQIIAALKVIDHLLLGAYVLPEEASVLPKRQPKQVKKAKKTSAKPAKTPKAPRAKKTAKKKSPGANK